MIVSHEHKFIFIKTKKTAGSTFEKLVYPYLGDYDICTGSTRDNTPSLGIQPNQNGHMWWNEIQAQYARNEWKTYFKFTIERNPWDKMVSAYYWHQKIKPEQFLGMDFETYCLTCNLIPNDWNMYSAGDQPVVNKIYKYEEMNEMYHDLNERFGFNIQPEQISNTKLKSNIRQVKDYHDIHTPKTIEVVRRAFDRTIQLLNYEY